MLRAVLSVWVLSAVVCLGWSDNHPDGHPDDSQDAGHDDHHNKSEQSASELVSGANMDFATRLYRKLVVQPDLQGKNIIFSPISVSVALATLSVGARGKTHKQIFTGLGFNSSLLTQVDVDKAFHTLLTKLNGDSHGNLSTGTAVFVDDTFEPRPQYMQAVKESYLADVFSVDFSNTTESEDTINMYVAEKTHGKIEKLVEGLDSATVMYLVSFMYFKGKWNLPFDPDLTEEDFFHVDEQTKVPVQMMNLEEILHIYYDQEIHTFILQLHYNSSSSMLLVLPDKGLAEVEEVIGQNHVNKWLKSMKASRRNLYLPKFSVKMSSSLNNVLIEMGMADMFGSTADLRGISSLPLFVSEVAHQATLDVDEAGAAAAAATGINAIPLSAQLPSPWIKFNRPFMVVITESDHGNILFMGKIVNPNI